MVSVPHEFRDICQQARADYYRMPLVYSNWAWKMRHTTLACCIIFQKWLVSIIRDCYCCITPFSSDKDERWLTIAISACAVCVNHQRCFLRVSLLNTRMQLPPLIRRCILLPHTRTINTAQHHSNNVPKVYHSCNKMYFDFMFLL